MFTVETTPKAKSVQFAYAVKNLEMHNDYVDYSPHPKLMALLCTELNAPKLDTKTFGTRGFGNISCSEYNTSKVCTPSTCC